MQEKILIKEKEFSLQREFTRAKKATARVRGNKIIIKIPSYWPGEEGSRVFQDLKRRIIARIEKNFEDFVDFEKNKFEFKDGQEINVFGKRFLISIYERETKNSYAKLNGEKIVIMIAKGLEGEKKKEHISNLAYRTISRSVLPFIKGRINELNEKYFQVEIKKVFLKNNVSSWGSCSYVGNINLNFKLLFAPEEIINYVIIHELAHRKEQNHSPAFWSLVNKAVPNYKECIKWLRENGKKITSDNILTFLEKQ